MSFFKEAQRHPTPPAQDKRNRPPLQKSEPEPKSEEVYRRVRHENWGQSYPRRTPQKQ